MTDLLAYRAQRARAMAKHPAGSQRVNPDTEPAYICVLCTGPIGNCDCIPAIQDSFANRYWPVTFDAVERIAEAAVEKALDRMAERSIAMRELRQS